MSEIARGVGNTGREGNKYIPLLLVLIQDSSDDSPDQNGSIQSMGVTDHSNVESLGQEYTFLRVI